MSIGNVQLTLVETMEDANALMSWLGNDRYILGADTETTGLDWWRDNIRLVQVGDTTHGWAIPFERWGGLVHEIFNRYDRSMVFHNSKFDLHMLETAGVPIKRELVHDSMAMAHIMEPHKRIGLKAAATRHVDRAASKGDKELKIAFMKNKWNWATVPIDLPEYWVYSALDPVLAALLTEKLYPQVHAHHRELYETEVAVAQVLTDMERRGIRVDREYSRDRSHALEGFLVEMHGWLRASGAPANFSSDATMIKWFEAQGHVFTKRTSKGKTAFDAEVLTDMGHPVATQLLRWRKAAKTKTYFDSYEDFGHGDRIHTSIRAFGTKTGRMSAVRPNLQNIPSNRYVRNAFIPSEGNKLVLADFDQIELRIMAHYANERGLIDAVLRGEDLHEYIGKMIYQKDEISKAERDVTKGANFAKIYGAGVAKFADTAGIPFDQAGRFMKMYDAKFPGITRYMSELTNAVNRDGEVITPYLGRRQVAAKGSAYKVVNYFIQGTAADVLKKKIVELSMTDMSRFMLIPIHDEIAFDVPAEDAEEVALEIEKVLSETEAFSLPLSVGSDVVDRWGEKYDE